MRLKFFVILFFLLINVLLMGCFNSKSCPLEENRLEKVCNDLFGVSYHAKVDGCVGNLPYPLDTGSCSNEELTKSMIYKNNFWRER